MVQRKHDDQRVVSEVPRFHATRHCHRHADSDIGAIVQTGANRLVRMPFLQRDLDMRISGAERLQSLG